MKERLQAKIEELESTNEEIKSSNEEYQSIKEELQSASAELIPCRPQAGVGDSGEGMGAQPAAIAAEMSQCGESRFSGNRVALRAIEALLA